MPGFYAAMLFTPPSTAPETLRRWRRRGRSRRWARPRAGCRAAARRLRCHRVPGSARRTAGTGCPAAPAPRRTPGPCRACAGSAAARSRAGAVRRAVRPCLLRRRRRYAPGHRRPRRSAAAGPAHPHRRRQARQARPAANTF